MKNGIPYDLAMNELSNAETMAYAIAFSEMEGGKFNWDAMQWERRE